MMYFLEGRVQEYIMKNYISKTAAMESQSDSQSQKLAPAFVDSRENSQSRLRQLTNNNPRSLQLKQMQNHIQQSGAAQLKKNGTKISGVFNAPPGLIEALFTSTNTFGAHRFDYNVNFDVDEVGTQGTEGHRMGEFRQYFKGGYWNFGVKDPDYKESWTEDSLGTAKYGYRSRNTHCSTYLSSGDGTGDILNMWDKPEIQGINHPEDLIYQTDFKGEIVAVNGQQEVTEVIESKEWTVKGRGCADKKGKFYNGVCYSDVMMPRTKSANNSKASRKEQLGKYDKPKNTVI
jgi:hypothetical protein